MATSVKNVGKHWPDARSASIAILSQSLEHAVAGETDFNSFIVTDLIDLEAKEAAPVIERAIKEDRVDLSIVGDLDDVREEMGLLSLEEVEKRQADRLARLSSLSSIISPRDRGATPSSSYYNSANPARRTSSKKAKNKMSKQSRKKNRKR